MLVHIFLPSWYLALVLSIFPARENNEEIASPLVGRGRAERDNQTENCTENCQELIRNTDLAVSELLDTGHHWNRQWH